MRSAWNAAGGVAGAGRDHAPAVKPPEQIVAGISRDIDITTNFDGSELIIYGAIKRETDPRRSA